MKKFTLRGKKGNEATFTYNDENLLIAFNADAITELSTLGWLLEHLPTTISSLYELRDRQKYLLIEVPMDISFDTFWQEYGFKMGSKSKAESLYSKLSDADKTLCIGKIGQYKRYLACNEGIKQVYPERWIAHRRFENEFK